MEERPSCIDCKFVKILPAMEHAGLTHYVCTHKESFICRHEITGEPIYQRCEIARTGTTLVGGQCGEEGKLFEPRQSIFRKLKTK